MSWFKSAHKRNEERLEEMARKKQKADEREEEITRRTDALVELAKLIQRESKHDPGTR